MPKAIICEHGLATYKCKPCKRAYQARWYQEKKETILERRKAGYYENKEVILKQQREYRAKNLEHVRARDRLAKQKNVERTRGQAAARRDNETDEQRNKRLRRKRDDYEQNKSRYLAQIKARREADPHAHKAYASRRYDAYGRVARGICGATVPVSTGEGHRSKAGRMYAWAAKYATKKGIPYSIFYRCKVCQRSTPNVNKYCDDDQDVYNAMQLDIELYQLTKQLKKGIHHVRYQD